jgi:hypothetical protein
MVNTSPIKFIPTGTINSTSTITNEVGIMEINSNTNDLLAKLHQEFSNQDFYGLQYVLEDLFKDNVIQAKQNSTMDWYGLSDLTI